VSWIQKLKQHWKGGVTGALLAVGFGLVLRLSSFQIGTNLINWSYDLPFHNRPFNIPRELVLVYLDDDSHKDLGQPYNRSWDRGLYGRLLERLTAEHARGVSFDMVFSDTNPEHPEGDERFARAIKANGKVILGADYTEDQYLSHTFIRAIDPFFDAAAGWGMVQVLQDPDFFVRRHLHVPPNKDDDIYSSMTWELAKLVGSPYAQDPQERYRERWMNYYGPPGSLPNVSFKYALETNDFCPAGFFSNKVVMVGAYLKTYASGQRKDEVRTPYTTGYTVGPSVDSQATATLNLLRGDWLTRTTPVTEITLLVLGGLIFGIGLSLFRPMIAVGLAIAGSLAVAFIVQMFFNHERLWFPWLIIVAAQIPIALLWSVVFYSVQLYVQNRLFQQSLSMYLSPKLVKKFSSEKDILKPGAKKEMLTILFSDIASFTSISEGMDSDDLAHQMNQYFQSAVSNCIHSTDGTIVKYIGDAIFAFWNAPDGQLDHAMRGCEAALRFRDQPPQHMNGHLLVTRIGLHTGEANVGNFGSTSRVDYTAIGENINLASRMEGLNKHLGTEVLITGSVHDGVAGRLTTRFLGNFQLKGFEKAVSVFELVGQLDQFEKVRSLHEAFASAVKIFQQQKLNEAEAAFRQILETHPNDGPTKFYLKFLVELQEHPLPEDWTGEIELKEK